MNVKACTEYFLSVPMRDKTREEIEKMIDDMADAIVEWDKHHSALIPCIRHAYDPDRKNEPPVMALGHSISCMDGCDYVCFWDECYNNYRGCNIEYQVAHKYNMARLNYNPFKKKVELID